MGIDFQKFYTAANSPEIKQEKEQSWQSLKNVKTVLSIDRLDYTKGIINRLQGYELFLEKNPEWQKKVTLVMIVVPSRVGVEYYQQIKKQIDELVGKINGKFGSVEWTPIIYQYKFISFEPLVALYSASDVAMITPLRDGMNLISKEYVSCRPDGTGVLIISEMAGASKELAEAIVINPYNIEEIEAALKTALEMPKEEQIRRSLIMQSRLKRYDVIRWADDFLEQLTSVTDKQLKLGCRILGASDSKRLIKNFTQAGRRAVLLDYDGTLVPFAPEPKLAKPTEALLDILKQLAADKKTDLVIISGRDKTTLENWLGFLSAALIAEHGVWTKNIKAKWQLIKPLDSKWKSTILPILQLYSDRLPGAFVEEKEYSVVWHYRRAEPELASIRARELTDDLMAYTANLDVQILQGNKVVEVRCGGVTKGIAAMQLLAAQNYDFILALGDDWTDEEMFKALPETAWSIRVGLRSSHAKFNLRSHKEVIELLRELVGGEKAATPQG
jgi:trehalose 6-phosphate synthase/phosphatase